MKSQYFYHDIHGQHYIVEKGRDHRGNFIQIYLDNLVARPILTRSHKEGRIIQGHIPNLEVMVDLIELDTKYFVGYVVTFE